jgi:hypothetical protein
MRTEKEIRAAIDERFSTFSRAASDGNYPQTALMVMSQLVALRWVLEDSEE